MKKTLQVRLHAREPSVVELTVGDRVQLDRLVPCPHGTIAERRGALVGPGKTTLELEPGFHAFRTLADASLQVVRGGVDAAANASGKDPWPQPPPLEAVVIPTAGVYGDEAPGETPHFTIVPAIPESP